MITNLKLLVIVIITANTLTSSLAWANVMVFPNPVTYANLTTAFNAINAGIHGNGAVTVQINNSFTQTDSAALNGNVFTSCLIRPTANVTISGNIGDGVFPRAMIILNGADNVTIDGRIGGTGTTISLTLNNSNTTINAGSIKLQNGSSNNVIKYVQCIGVASGSTSGGRTIYIGSSTAANGGNNNNIVDSCFVIGGRRGIQTFGSAGVVTNNGSIFRGNKVKNQSDIGIFLGSEARDNTCMGNEVFMDAAFIAAGIGIRCQSVGVNDIKNNRVHSLTSTSSPTFGILGILLQPIALTAPGSNTTTINLINNFVSLTETNLNCSNLDGIIFYGGANLMYTLNVYFNSIRIGGFARTSMFAYSNGLRIESEVSIFTYNSANNIIINDRTGGGNAASAHVGAQIISKPSDIINSDHNIFFASNTTVREWHAGYNRTLFKDLALYKDSTCGANIEQNTMFKNVNFISNTDLHLAGPVGGDMCGKLGTGVTTDIDGNPRNALYPYKGADEGSPLKVLTLGAYFQGITSFGRTSQITIALRNITEGYQCIRSTCTANLISSGNAVLCFGDSVSNLTPYYIGIEQSGVKNSFLETWSASGQSFTGGLLNFNFQTSLSQAFGNNMGGSSSPFFVYGGDVNQDGIIDASDVASIDNSASNFTTGCRINTDINNDEIVDATDLAIGDNNASNFVSVMSPIDPTQTGCLENSGVKQYNKADSIIRRKLNNLSPDLNGSIY